MSQVVIPKHKETAVKIDPIIPKPEIVKASNLSEPTIYREQRAKRFPPFEQISARRVGLRLSVLNEWLGGRRHWGDAK